MEYVFEFEFTSACFAEAVTRLHVPTFVYVYVSGWFSLSISKLGSFK